MASMRFLGPNAASPAAHTFKRGREGCWIRLDRLSRRDRRTRVAAVGRAVAVGRASIRQLIRLRSDSVAALRAAAEIIRRMLDELDGSSG